jgi:hypothetical protein
VAPEGVFLLSVGVGDEQWAVMGALVRVISEAGTFSELTDIWGLVTLPVQGDVAVQVEKPGYVTIRKSMTISGDEGLVCTLQPSATAQRR